MTIRYPQALPRRRTFPVAILPLFFAVVAMLCASAFAADAATGTIQGRVLNAENGQYLSKAVVSVEGTSLQTLTDDFGNYTLSNVPAGVAKLNVKFTGELPATAAVNVTAGTVAHQDFAFNRDKAVTSGEATVVKLDRFVVETERYKNAAQIAINEERYSPTIKNVIAADSFGDIPDGNVGEFVKYIPGVQIGYGYDSTGLNAANSNATSISVRGFGPEMTAITIDGVPLTNASPATLTRAVGLDMMTINNASRIEVIKVPTPDMPADSPGGAINLITKSSFEYAKPYVNFHVGTTFNSEEMSHLLKRTPGPANKPTYKTLPAVDLTYVLPINKTMGVAVTGSWSKTFNQNHRGISDYFYDTKDINSSSSYAIDLRPGGGPNVNVKGGADVTQFTSASGVPLDLAHPALWRFQSTDTPNTETRTSGSLRFDWRPTPSHKIQVGYTLGLFSSVDAQRRLQFHPDKNYMKNWGPDFVESYTFIPKGTVVNGKALTSDFNPKAAVDMTVTTRDRDGTTHTGYLKYDWQHGPWLVHAEASGSRSRGSFKDMPNGHFSELETSLSAGYIAFKNINEGIPGQIILNDKSGNPVDWGNLANWAAPSIQAKSGQTDSMDEHFTMRADIQRELDFINIPKLSSLVAKTGWYRDVQIEKKSGLGTGYRMTYYGPTLALTDYLDDGYSGISPGWGLPGQQWVSTYKLFELWQQHPDYFNAESDADMANNYTSWANQQKSIKETKDEFYAMIRGNAFHNRFNWVLGSREQIRKRNGYATRADSAWNYVKATDGTIYRDATYPTGVKIDSASSVLFAQTTAGTALRSTLDKAGISYPTAPVLNNSYAMKVLQLKPFTNMDGRITGKPTFTVSGTYRITDNFDATLSWNRAQANPDFEDGVLTSAVTGFSISENSDPTALPRGTIKIPNPNLQAAITNSWNLRLGYYTQSGGKFTVSPFITYVKNWHDTFTIDQSNPLFGPTLESLSLDPTQYEDYQVQTTINGPGTSKTLGYELEADQQLGILGALGSHFRVFSSFSHQYKKENNTTKLSAKPTANSTASAGITFTGWRFSVLARALWTQEKYLSQQKTYLYNGNSYVLGKFTPSMVALDINLRYQLSSHYSLYADARNVLNKSQDTIWYDKTGIVPSYAYHTDRSEFGINWNVGINGTF